LSFVPRRVQLVRAGGTRRVQLVREGGGGGGVRGIALSFVLRRTTRGPSTLVWRLPGAAVGVCGAFRGAAPGECA
jgi:hypothetical protein